MVGIYKDIGETGREGSMCFVAKSVGFVLTWSHIKYKEKKRYPALSKPDIKIKTTKDSENHE